MFYIDLHLGRVEGTDIVMKINDMNIQHIIHKYHKNILVLAYAYLSDRRCV